MTRSAGLIEIIAYSEETLENLHLMFFLNTPATQFLYNSAAHYKLLPLAISCAQSADTNRIDVHSTTLWLGFLCGYALSTVIKFCNLYNSISNKKSLQSIWELGTLFFASWNTLACDKSSTRYNRTRHDSLHLILLLFLTQLKSQAVTQRGHLHYPVSTMFWPFHSLFIEKGLQRSSSASRGVTHLHDCTSYITLPEGFSLCHYLFPPPLFLHLWVTVNTSLRNAFYKCFFRAASASFCHFFHSAKGLCS